jgi:hypothetical protein
LAKNQQFSVTTQYIYICHHYVRDLLEMKLSELQFQKSENSSSDTMTKKTTREILRPYTTKFMMELLIAERRMLRLTHLSAYLQKVKMMNHFLQILKES